MLYCSALMYRKKAGNGYIPGKAGDSEMSLKSGEVLFSEHGNSVAIPESISLFGFTISFYGICLALAALAGIVVSFNELKKQKKDEEQVLTLITLVIVSALLGARAYYVIFQWQVFAERPLLIFNLRSGGLAYYGALFGAWFAVRWYCRKKKTDFGSVADGFSIGAAVASVPVWLGCAFAREPVGRFYNGLFSIHINAAYIPEGTDVIRMNEILSHAYGKNGNMQVSVHPVPVYGIVLSILILLCILVVKRYIRQSGGVFTLYLFLNGISCLILESFRADSCFIWGTAIPVNYVVSSVLLLVIATEFVRRYLKNRHPQNRVR